MKLKYLVLHCTATPEGREVTSKEIRAWHTSPKPQGRGWKQVGYSDIIHLDGNIENLTPYDEDDDVEKWEITNGAAGINSISRHVVYSGGTDKAGKPKDTRTKEQLLAMANYCKQVVAAHPNILIAGHNQFTKAKACPSFDTVAWLTSIGIPAKNIYKK